MFLINHKNINLSSLWARGGTGKTILLKDPVMDINLVCKKFDPIEENNSTDSYNRFIEEIKIMYQLFHKNIVQIYNYQLYPQQNTGYILMEYIEGMSINDYFLFYPEEDLNSIFTQTIHAFSYLESKHILHRDIRPENIMVTKDGNVKIIDFGFGKSVQQVKDESASIFLNWPASQLPLELIEKKQYNHQTEIFYIGYLFRNIIKKNSISTFNYDDIISDMIQSNEMLRFSSFQSIASAIDGNAFSKVDFNDTEKYTYSYFADSLSRCLATTKGPVTLESDPNTVLESLNSVLLNNALESTINNVSDVISCFIKSGYTYYHEEITFDALKDFVGFFSTQTSKLQTIILNNLYGRIKRVKNIDDSDVLPFT